MEPGGRNGPSDSDAGRRHGNLRRRQRHDPRVGAEGTSGKRAGHRRRRGAQALLRRVSGSFESPDKDDARPRTTQDSRIRARSLHVDLLGCRPMTKLRGGGAPYPHKAAAPSFITEAAARLNTDYAAAAMSVTSRPHEGEPGW